MGISERRKMFMEQKAKRQLQRQERMIIEYENKADRIVLRMKLWPIWVVLAAIAVYLYLN